MPLRFPYLLEQKARPSQLTSFEAPADQRHSASLNIQWQYAQPGGAMMQENMPVSEILLFGFGADALAEG